MDADELEKELKILINDIGATSMADMGKVMAKAMAVYKGKADGSLRIEYGFYRSTNRAIRFRLHRE